MNAFLELLAKVLEQFISIFPNVHARPATTQWSLIDSWLLGVYVVKRPVLYLPVMDHVEHWDKTVVPQDSDIQTITLADGQSITLNTAFEYRIIDPIKCRDLWSDNYLSSINIAVRSEITAAFRDHTWENVSEVDIDAIFLATWERFDEGGIELVSLSIEEFASCESTRHWGVNLVQ